MGDLGEGEDTEAKLLVQHLESWTGSLITLAQDTAHGTAALWSRHLEEVIQKALGKVVNFGDVDRTVLRSFAGGKGTMKCWLGSSSTDSVYGDLHTKCGVPQGSVLRRLLFPYTFSQTIFSPPSPLA